MAETLFEIETWRNGWFYKFGSEYAGPFEKREDAIAAAMVDLAPLTARHPASMRATLADLAWR